MSSVNWRHKDQKVGSWDWEKLAYPQKSSICAQLTSCSGRNSQPTRQKRGTQHDGLRWKGSLRVTMRACRVDSQLPKFKNIFDVGFSCHVICKRFRNIFLLFLLWILNLNEGIEGELVSQFSHFKPDFVLWSFMFGFPYLPAVDLTLLYSRTFTYHLKWTRNFYTFYWFTERIRSSCILLMK